MIYTCTLNPSVDYIVEVDHFKVGSLNRASFESKYPGGKGINVARVLHRLGLTSRAFGFIGGFTGDYIEKYLTAEEIEVNFIKVNEDSRINIKLKTGEETEINGQGPTIAPEKLATLYNQLEQLTQDDVFVMAGSIPNSIPSDVYKKMAIKCNEKNIPFVLDTSGQGLFDVLPFKPFLIKPNQHELGELFQVEIETVEDAVTYGKKLVELGSQNVIISLGGKGAIFLNNELILHAEVPSGVVKNSVGAGDSLVAGFVGGFVRTNDYQSAFLQGVAAGTATAFSTDLCTNEEVEKIKEKVKISKL